MISNRDRSIRRRLIGGIPFDFTPEARVEIERSDEKTVRRVSGRGQPRVSRAHYTTKSLGERDADMDIIPPSSPLECLETFSARPGILTAARNRISSRCRIAGCIGASPGVTPLRLRLAPSCPLLPSRPPWPPLALPLVGLSFLSPPPASSVRLETAEHSTSFQTCALLTRILPRNYQQEEIVDGRGGSGGGGEGMSSKDLE